MIKAKKIRGADPKEYAKMMHAIERGDVTESSLIRQGKLKPSRRGGILPLKRASAQIFSNKVKSTGRGKTGECRVPSCRKDSARRGLCNTHRTEAYRMIRHGKTTEKNLLNRKLLLPPKTGRAITVLSKGKVSKPQRHKKLPKKSRSRKRLPQIGASFPKKLLNSTVCLFRGCKSPRRGGSRGLCTKHYSQFKRKRAKLSDNNRIKQEKDLIKRKMLLPPRVRSRGKSKRVRRIKMPESNAFNIGSKMRGSIRHY